MKLPFVSSILAVFLILLAAMAYLLVTVEKRHEEDRLKCEQLGGIPVLVRDRFVCFTPESILREPNGKTETR
jgi:hypothetical protein